MTWQDDNKPPLLANITSLSIGLYTGSQQQQTLLAVLDPSVRAAAEKSTVRPLPLVQAEGPA